MKNVGEYKHGSITRIRMVKFLTHSAPFYFEFVSSILLALSNAFCVAYVTSAKGPGSSIGNLYYMYMRGQVKMTEHIEQGGVPSFAKALHAMFSGGHTGKLLVQMDIEP